MKRIIGTLFATFLFTNAWAQVFAGYSNRTTAYETYQPARVTLTTGKVIMQKQANVFLKNGRLLFKNGKHDMEADMRQIETVDFADRSYVRVDTILAFVVDTVAKNRILCTTTIDLEAFNKQKLNDRTISSLRLGDQQINAASLEAPDDDNQYPLVNNYYLEIDGEIVRCHERVLRRMLPKTKRSRLDFYLSQPDFNWSDKKCLRQVLELFTDNEN